MSIIAVNNLSLRYRTPVREAGLRAAFASLLRREFREIRAVQGISFALEPGEVVGFIGPNGAGKTSTLKMLSGILHPTAGEAFVLGFTPWRRERNFLKGIAMIRGSQPIGAAWQFGRYPVDIYRQPIRFILTYVLPVAFISTVPTRVLVQSTGLLQLASGLVVGAGAIVLAQLVWSAGLRRYTSATS